MSCRLTKAAQNFFFGGFPFFFFIMYSDADEDAHAMDLVDGLCNSIDWKKIGREHRERVKREPCQPIPNFTNQQELDEVLEKKLRLDQLQMMDVLIEKGIPRAEAHKLLFKGTAVRYFEEEAEDFRKILCSSWKREMFCGYVSLVEEDLAKYTRFEDVRSKLTFSE